MSLPAVIGLTGFARSGKDSAAAILRDVAGYQRVALADPLRQIALAIDPWVHIDRGYPVTLSELVARKGWDGAKALPRVRELLQRLGTEGGRQVLGEDVWVRAWARRAREVLDNGGRVACTDVRFPNEAAAVRQAHGEIWRIERPGVQAVNAHVSDTGTAAIHADVVVKNVGTLDDLRAGVAALLEERMR